MKNNGNILEKLKDGVTVDKGNCTKGYVFVIMSFSGNGILESYYEEAIAPTVQKYDLRCVRVDQEKFTGRISEKITDGIDNALFVIADLTEDKPNCYFEAGYAVAKEKIIIFQRLNAPKYEPKFHFDIQDYKHIIYSKISDLRSELDGIIKKIVE
jgi:hypothetical protein